MASLRRTLRPNFRIVRPVTRAQSTSSTVSSDGSQAALVSDGDIGKLTAKPLRPFSLNDLVRYGRPPLSAAALYENANFAISILPSRLAYRIRALRGLPFIVVTNPHVSQIYNNYMQSLATLLPFAEHGINNQKEEASFTEAVNSLVQTHANTIPVLARGFLESRKYISPEAITAFLEEHLRARIGTRLIAEQHIALHYSSQPILQESTGSSALPKDHSTYIGIIDTALNPARIIRNCESFVADICEFKYGVRPTVIIDGEPEATIAHVPVHLEYMMTELLKNAFRATIERGQEREPIQVTIAPAPDTSMQSPEDGKGVVPEPVDADLAINLDAAQGFTPGVTIRIRDRGGGISPEHLANIWNYSFTTFDEHQANDATGSIDALSIISNASAGESSIAGLGYGLPLSRAYAEYFGGGIALQSLYGWGTDVFITLRGIDR